jgi:hypothetical protein
VEGKRPILMFQISLKEQWKREREEEREKERRERERERFSLREDEGRVWGNSLVEVMFLPTPLSPVDSGAILTGVDSGKMQQGGVSKVNDFETRRHPLFPQPHSSIPHSSWAARRQSLLF